MGINLTIGSTSSAVLLIGIGLIVYGNINNNASLTSLGTLLAVLGGIVVGVFVLLSLFRNFRSL